MSTSTTTTVGRFTFDTATSELEGPAEFIRSADYQRLIADIEGGRCHTFAAACEHSPDFVTALLVTVQTCYAGWHGMREFNRSRGL